MSADAPLVVAFEARRRKEMASLLERNGLRALVAPVMQEVARPPSKMTDAVALALDAGRIDVVILRTGTGVRALAAVVERVLPRERLAARLSACVVAARGPKTVLALKELGVTGAVVAPEPFTSDLLVEALVARGSVAGKSVIVVEDGGGTTQLRLGRSLLGLGARVTALPVYDWQLPGDLAPAYEAIDALLRGDARAALFTSAPQVDRLLTIAHLRGDRDAVRAALARTLVGSIGPTCSARLRERGLPPDVEPAHAHMGHLAKAVAERLASRQSGTP